MPFWTAGPTWDQSTPTDSISCVTTAPSGPSVFAWSRRPSRRPARPWWPRRRSTRRRLTEALLAAHSAPELKSTLDELLIARFVPADATAFDVMLERQRQAEAAGYSRLA